MKGAEELYYELCDKYIETRDRKHIVVMAMHEYANQMMEIQREMCGQHLVDNEYGGRHLVKELKTLMRNAPEPSLP